MTAVQQFTKPFKRLFNKPLDIDLVFETYVAMQAYLSSGNRYSGMVVTCKENEGQIYILNNTGTAWLSPISEGDHNRIHALDSILDHAPVESEKRNKFLKTNNEGHIIFSDGKIGYYAIINGQGGSVLGSTHSLGTDIVVTFYNRENNVFTPISIYYTINESTGRVDWQSSFQINNGKVIIR